MLRPGDPERIYRGQRVGVFTRLVSAERLKVCRMAAKYALLLLARQVPPQTAHRLGLGARQEVRTTPCP